MRLRVERNVLLMCVNRLARIVSPRAPAPLSCVLMQVEHGSVLMTTMDAAIVSRIRVNAQVEETGRALVPVHRFRSVIDAMQDREIVVGTEGTSVFTSLGRRRLVTEGLDPDQYPALPTMAATPTTLSVSADAFAGVLKFTQHAAHTDPEVVHGFGVRLLQAEGRLRAMATDGKRGAMASVPAEGPDMDVFVIRPALREVTGWMADRVNIARDGARIELSCSNAWVSWRDGTPATPDLRTFFGEEPSFSLEVPRLLLLDAVKAVTKVGNENEVSSNLIVLRISPEGEVTLSAKADGSSATDGLEGSRLRGKPDPRPVGVNGAFLAEMLSASMSGIVQLGFAEPLAPVRILTPDVDGIIMPIRLAEDSHA